MINFKCKDEKKQCLKAWCVCHAQNFRLHSLATLVTDFFLFDSKTLTKTKTYDHFPTFSTRVTSYIKYM